MIRGGQDRAHPRQGVFGAIADAVVWLQGFVGQGRGCGKLRREVAIDFGIGIDDRDGVVFGDAHLRQRPGDRAGLTGIRRRSPDEAAHAGDTGDLCRAVGAIVGDHHHVHPLGGVTQGAQGHEAGGK